MILKLEPVVSWRSDGDDDEFKDDDLSGLMMNIYYWW